MSRSVKQLTINNLLPKRTFSFSCEFNKNEEKQNNNKINFNGVYICMDIM